MAEYIELEALMKFPIRRDHYDQENGNEHFINGIEFVLEYAENLPSADVTPVVHGMWELYPSSMHRRCSVCNMEYDRPKFNVRANYCPNCGARMDLDV